MSCKIKISTPRGMQVSLCRLTVAYQKEIDNPSLFAEEKQAMESLFAAIIQNARVEPEWHFIIQLSITMFPAKQTLR